MLAFGDVSLNPFMDESPLGRSLTSGPIHDETFFHAKANGHPLGRSLTSGHHFFLSDGLHADKVVKHEKSTKALLHFL